MIKRIVLVAATCTVLFSGQHVVKAGITNYASTYIHSSLSYASGDPPGYNQTDQQPLSSTLSAAASYSKLGDSGSAMSVATATLNPLGAGFDLSGSYDATSVHPNNGYGVGADAYTQSAWQDILRLSNSNPSLVGQDIKLTFFVTGTIYDSQTGPLTNYFSSSASATFNASAANTYGGNTIAYSQASVFENSGAAPGTFSSNGSWDNLTYKQIVAGVNTYDLEHTYSGYYSLIVPISTGYDPYSPGSIFFSVGANAAAYTGAYYYTNQEAGGSFDPTLVSVTLPDVGNVTPESLGVSLTFDSGMLSPNVVPEPPSVILMVLGSVIGLGVYAKRRRSPQIA